MHKIWSLSKIMIKSSFDDQFNAFKGKKNSGIKSLLVFGLLGIYLVGIVLFLGSFFLDALIRAQQPSLFIFIINFVMPILIFALSLFSIPIILYYSNDNASYFVMPLKPSEIVAAKSIAIYLQSLVSTAAFLIPLYTLYFIKVDTSIISILFGYISILIIPILPVVCAILLIVLLFTFTPFFRNKEIFTYVSTLSAVFLGLGISQIVTFLDIDTSSINAILESLQSGNDAVSSLISSIFPTTRFLTNTIAFGSMLDLLLAVTVSIVGAGIVFFITEPLYFRAVLLFSESKKSGKRMSLNQLNKENNQKNIILSFMQYDFKNIIRTPAFVSNYYLPIILLPIVFAFSIYTLLKESSSLPLNDIQYAIQTFTSNFSPLELIVFTYILSVIIGLFFTNMGNTTSTLISREGMNTTEFLMFPTPLSNLIKAKIYNTLITTAIIPIVFLLTIIILFSFPLYTLPFAIIGVLVGSSIVAFIGAWVDMLSPRLNWVNEQDAVKGNFRQMFVILPFMFIPFVLGAILIATQSLIVWSLLSLASLIIVLPLIRYVLNYADTKLIGILQNR